MAYDRVHWRALVLMVPLLQNVFVSISINSLFMFGFFPQEFENS
jgi:hypothetical protein